MSYTVSRQLDRPASVCSAVRPRRSSVHVQCSAKHHVPYACMHAWPALLIWISPPLRPCVLAITVYRLEPSPPHPCRRQMKETASSICKTNFVVQLSASYSEENNCLVISNSNNTTNFSTSCWILNYTTGYVNFSRLIDFSLCIYIDVQVN